jgi:DNA invertase Pin-like site-specific DNA recombinase
MPGTLNPSTGRLVAVTVIDDLRKAGRKFDRATEARDAAAAELADAIRAAAAAGATWNEIINTAGVDRRTVERALKSEKDR